MISTLFGGSSLTPINPDLRALSAGKDGQPGSSYSIYEWSRRMLGGRSLIRNGRQRRVLSKHIHRTSSLTQTESSSNTLLPNYVYVIALLLSLSIFSFRNSLILCAACFFFRKVLCPHIYTFLGGYRKRTSHHGPTSREKCYYYLDYWISTNP